jgi:hypothetical protein
MYNQVIWPEQYGPTALEAAIWVLGEALGAFSIAPASGTHEQAKERGYEYTQF